MLQPRLYTSSSKLLLGLDASTNSTAPVGLDPEEIATQAEVVRSDAVARSVIDRLDLDVSVEDLLASVTVEAVDNKRVVLISVDRPDADEAAAVANAFANEYVDLRIRKAAHHGLDRPAGVRGALTQLRDELDSVRDKIDQTPGPPI